MKDKGYALSLSKGFAPLIIIVITTLVIGAGIGGFLVLREKKIPPPENEKTARQEESLQKQKTKLGIQLPETSSTEDTISPIESALPPLQRAQFPKPPLRQPSVELPSSSPPPPPISLPSSAPRLACEGSKTTFDYPPVNLDKTSMMLPRGLMTGDHVIPVGNHYFQNFDNQKFDIEIYSPGKGYITTIQRMPGAEEGKDYLMFIEHTCTIDSIYTYVSNLPAKIYKHIAGKEYVGDGDIRIPVEAGELIGYYKNNLDYSIVDKVVGSNRIHIDINTYEYFNEPARSKLIEKSIRTAEPISGKMDYDINGKLVGNWFLEGTNGYAGSGERNWIGHLSIVYDYMDPKRIVISIGGYEGQDSRQFVVKGNTPDPADISKDTGIITYELVEIGYRTKEGETWDRRSFAKITETFGYDKVLGVVLVQMIENRKIKFEAFPGKTGAEVSGFTSAARIYER